MSIVVAAYLSCCAPRVERWRQEFVTMKRDIIADYHFVVKNRRITRRRPEKGIVRIVMIAGWCVLHLYAIIVFSLFHAYEAQPVHAFWWFWSTLFAGLLYVATCYSNPGFIDKETLLRLTEGLNLGVTVVGSDPNQLPGVQAADGAAATSAGIEMTPMAERPMRPASEERRAERGGDVSGSESEDDEFAPDALDGSALANKRARSRFDASPQETDDAFAAWDAATNGDEPPREPPRSPRRSPRPTGSTAPAASPPTTEAGVVAAVVAAEVTIDMRDDEDTAEVASRSRKVPPGKGRCKIDPATSSSATPRTADGVELGDMYGGGAPADEEDVGASDLKRQLALSPRIVGIPEEGQEEVAREAARIAKARREAPKGVNDYFSGYCDDADMYLPLRAKFCKKHGRIVAKFDHYCYVIGTSVGELNHGRYYRLLSCQLISIWTGLSLSYRAEVWFNGTLAWTVVNTPLLIVNVLSWAVGVPLSILWCIHTFNMLTSSTTYEFVKLEKLEYMEGFYQFSFPFSQGLFGNIGHFCCPAGILLWARPPPESEWEDTFWRNKYYSCCG